MAKLMTEDKILVKTGSLIYYVNYLGQIKPVIFNKGAKSTVKYFSLIENALKYKEKVFHDNKNTPRWHRQY